MANKIDELTFYPSQLPVLADGRIDYTYLIPGVQPTKDGWQFAPGVYTPTTTETVTKFVEENVAMLAFGAVALILALSIGGRRK